ncbi:MAG: endonuclease/exonuclease/phosphatase family protein [Saprospiraceae bacterium]
MHKKLIFFLVYFLAVNNSLLLSQMNVINMMTFNIRLSTAEKDTLDNWEHRKQKVYDVIDFMDTDIFGVQEAKPDQLKDLQKYYGSSYKYIGLPRETGVNGEFCAIFYSPSRFEVLAENTFWLSENPQNSGVKGWDAACPRIVTYGKFKDKIYDKTFFVFNTHFDHIGQIARRESAKLLLQKVSEIAGEQPVMVMGDFNSKPKDEPITTLCKEFDQTTLIDSKELSLSRHFGPTGTFNGFGTKETSNEPIDYIFIKNSVRVLKHATLSTSWNGRFASDHFPVFARIIL